MQVFHCLHLKAILFVFCCIFAENYTLSTWVDYLFLPNPSYRTDQNGKTLEFTSSEACCKLYVLIDCFCCMCWRQHPMLHHGVHWQKSCTSWSFNSNACWNIHILGKEGQNDILPWIQPCPVSLLHRCSTKCRDLHPMSGPVCYLATNNTAYLPN